MVDTYWCASIILINVNPTDNVDNNTHNKQTETRSIIVTPFTGATNTLNHSEFRNWPDCL
jgi:hypothetical protein